MVATDRISAFDVILPPTGIPDNGRYDPALVLVVQPDPTPSRRTTWFRHGSRPAGRSEAPLRLAGRFMVVPQGQADPISSAWSAATWPARPGRNTASSGPWRASRLPTGLVEVGAACRNRSSPPRSRTRRATTRTLPSRGWPGAASSADTSPTRSATLSVALYDIAAEEADKKGLILADTKFEFGLIDRRLILIDEALLARSFPLLGPRLAAVAGPQTPPSADKQFVRDWLVRQRLGPQTAGAGAAARGRRPNPGAVPQRLQTR